MIRDSKPVVIDNFMGLHSRGIQPPLDHATECWNCIFADREVQSRYGTSLSISMSNIRRIEVYKRPGEATRLLILDSSGNLYDSTNLASPILQIPGMTDFKMQVFFTRAYITPLSGESAVPGSFIYVYDGTGAARKAAGTRPAGTLVASESANAGNVEAGFHLYAVAFETQSGFITKPGPAIYALLESSGTKKVILNGIPTGPAGTTKRHILATKAIIVYDGNQEGYEFFFVPNGTISDNVTTSYEIDFFDADLIASAEYLFDQYEELPAAAGISQYRGRMIFWNENYIYVSRPGEPESFDALSGLILVGPGEASYIQDCVEYRDVLYITKKYQTFATSDNGLDPSSWTVTSVDKGTGSTSRGIIKILDSQGTSIDKFLVISPRGLLLYNGFFMEPELTAKIRDVWHRINKDYFHLAHGVNDTKNSRLFVAVPLDSNTQCSHIFYGDYSLGLDPVNIRWSIWNSSVWQPTSIIIDIINNAPTLRIGASDGVYNESASRMDVNSAIDSYYTTSYFGGGMLYVCKGIQFECNGQGTLDVSLQSLQGQTSTLSPVSLGNNDFFVPANFVDFKTAAKFRVNAAGDWFRLTRVNLLMNILWTQVPA